VAGTTAVAPQPAATQPVAQPAFTQPTQPQPTYVQQPVAQPVQPVAATPTPQPVVQQTPQPAFTQPPAAQPTYAQQPVAQPVQPTPQPVAAPQPMPQTYTQPTPQSNPIQRNHSSTRMDRGWSTAARPSMLFNTGSPIPQDAAGDDEIDVSQLGPAPTQTGYNNPPVAQGYSNPTPTPAYANPNPTPAYTNPAPAPEQTQRPVSAAPMKLNLPTSTPPPTPAPVVQYKVRFDLCELKRYLLTSFYATSRKRSSRFIWPMDRRRLSNLT